MASFPKHSSFNFKWLLLGISILVSCFIGEELIRWAVVTDADGNQFIRQRHLKPFRLPVESTRRKVQAWQEGLSFLVYDPVLGWRPKAGSVSMDGKYHYNQHGIRASSTSWTMSTADSVFKIAIFGDSFVHGDEVPFEATWGYVLQENMKELGIQTEVWNFGVSGYGMKCIRVISNDI